MAMISSELKAATLVYLNNYATACPLSREKVKKVKLALCLDSDFGLVCLSAGIQRHAIHTKSTDVSEEHVALTFRVEE
jgi:hypothetical protein